jgi:hypothetical protein
MDLLLKKIRGLKVNFFSYCDGNIDVFWHYQSQQYSIIGQSHKYTVLGTGK